MDISLNSVGVLPVQLSNFRLKCCAVLKPHRAAISPMGRFVNSKCFFATAILYCHKYSIGVAFSSFLKSCVKVEWLIEAALVMLSRVISSL